MDAFIALFIALLCILAWIVNRKPTLWVCPAGDGTRILTGTNRAEIQDLYSTALARGYGMLLPIPIERLMRIDMFAANMARHVHACAPFCIPYVSCKVGQHTRTALLWAEGDDESELRALGSKEGFTYVESIKEEQPEAPVSSTSP